MATVGIRELKEQTSEIMRRVRDEGETVDITYRGQVVASIVPKRSYSSVGEEEFWDEHWDLVRKISERSGAKSVDVLALLDDERQEVSPETEWPTGSEQTNT